jgi:hypothetical protein
MRFQAFILDQWGNSLEMKDLQCETVSEALQRAKGMVEGRSVELWEGDRLVERFTPKAWRPFEVR